MRHVGGFLRSILGQFWVNSEVNLGPKLSKTGPKLSNQGPKLSRTVLETSKTQSNGRVNLHNLK